MPAELFDAGRLRDRTLDPTVPAADSRSVWHRGGADLEIQIPWALAGFSDPVVTTGPGATR